MRIVVASKSKHKVNAVIEALAKCRLDGEHVQIASVGAPSNIPEQPSGAEQTRMGATNRARNAKALDSSADMWIGIESGILGAYGSFYDVAFIVLLLSDGRTVSAMAGGHEVPKEYVKEANERGYDRCTAGAVMAERTGCDATDGTTRISHGHVSRSDTLVQALMIAFGDWTR